MVQINSQHGTKRSWNAAKVFFSFSNYRLKLDLLLNHYSKPTKTSEALDLLHQHLSVQLGEDKVYCGPVLPHCRHNINYRNIVLCLKNDSLNEALDIPLEYRSSLNFPNFVTPPKIPEYSWKCILIPPTRVNSSTPLSGYELYKVKHLSQLGYEVVIFGRRGLEMWKRSGFDHLFLTENILIRDFDELQ